MRKEAETILANSLKEMDDSDFADLLEFLVPGESSATDGSERNGSDHNQ